MRVMPILILLFILNILDRSNIGNAKVRELAHSTPTHTLTSLLP